LIQEANISAYNSSLYEILSTEVFQVVKENDNYGKRRVRSSVNPQGYAEETRDHQPKSQLEQRAKKKNTKI
jgi:small acid-soluble spore protein L (minor)